MVQRVHGQQKMDFFLSSFFLGGSHGVEGWTWEDQEVSVIRVHYVKFPNNQ